MLKGRRKMQMIFILIGMLRI